MRFQEDLSLFFFDFGELVTLQFSDGTSRQVTAIFDDEFVNAEVGSYHLDTTQPQITVRTSDIAGLRWRDDFVQVRGVTYNITISPQSNGTGLSVVHLALQEGGINEALL